tara:strand:+ start:381 stop:1229 length:849 start_codon:yes stop_codon:yes gene_type:complete
MNYLEILSEKSKNLKDFAFKNKVDYRIAHPFPHIEIKDFFSNSFLNDVLSQFPDLSKYNKSQIYENKNEIKFANNDLEKYPEKIKIFFNFLNSEIFLDFLQNITSIEEKLIADPELNGGGLHEIKSGGLLKVHTDFSKHPNNGLDRRVNVLIYLNKDWKENYKGNLELWDEDMKSCKKSIRPTFNNMVIFSTNDFSNHGHPDPIICPDNISRKSIALYYFSKGRPKSDILNSSLKNRTYFKSRLGHKGEAIERKERIKNFFRKFEFYKKIKNFEKKYLRKKK